MAGRVRLGVLEAVRSCERILLRYPVEDAFQFCAPSKLPGSDQTASPEAFLGPRDERNEQGAGSHAASTRGCTARPAGAAHG